MIIAIIAGGSGTRLWPLSVSKYPKHLLKLTGARSLLQNTVTRAELLTNDIYIISEASHIEHVYEQLPQIPKDHIIVEPGRRGTASCFLALLARLKDRISKDEAIVFMFADHHIRDTESFYEAIRQAADISVKHQRMVLLGVEPTYAATGFGYIERDQRLEADQAAYQVKSFKEKPDHKTAESYLAAGRYLWNMGYFAAPLPVFERDIKTFAPQLWQNYQKLLTVRNTKTFNEAYLSFASEPIDTALTEQVEDLLVTPGTFDWVDVGSFPDVHHVSAQDEDGNTLQGLVEVDHVTNSLVRNDTETPVAVIGLDNVAVISTPYGILVTNKSHAQKVKDVSKRFSKGES